MSGTQSSELDLDKLKKAIEYIDKLNASRKALTDEVARKMGIDPVNDVILVPSTWVQGINPLPQWMARSANKTLRLLPGVHNRMSKFPKKEKNE